MYAPMSDIHADYIEISITTYLCYYSASDLTSHTLIPFFAVLRVGDSWFSNY